TIPVYSNDGLSRDYDPSPGAHYPEAAYGFQRFQANVGGMVDAVGLDRLNPQLQETLVDTSAGLPRGKANGKPRAGMNGRPAADDARNRSGRPHLK
ncbi:MAG TPA: hypothetical protein VNT54_04905, partial [Solirubrobacteraceae bacterium]|nr:hypothetical protein [Solirubrobacteraceae bacterium]